MNEKESAQNDEKNDVKIAFIPKEPTGFDINKITETGINFLDNIVSNIEKEAKKQLKTIPDNNEKVSKRKGKNETIETTEIIDDTILFDTENLKKQYIVYAEMAMVLFNPLLQKEGIEPITSKEIADLINAIFDLVGKYLNKVGASVQSTLKITKNFMKWIGLLKAISAIFAPRIKEIQEVMVKNRAKKVVKKLNKESVM